MEKKFISAIVVYLVVACNTPIKNNNMTEKYDFEAIKNSKTHPCCIKKGNKIVLMYSMAEDGGYYEECPDSSSFYHAFKSFYPNGVMKSQGTCVGNRYRVGIWRYYDKKGNLIKEEDIDAKFGKIKVNDILKFIEKEGWINLKTGEGGIYPIINEKMEYVDMKYCIFDLSFWEKGRDIPMEESDPPRLWVVTIQIDRTTSYHFTVYRIDGDTGELLMKHSYVAPVFY